MFSSRTPSAASSLASAMTSSIGFVACLPRILGIAQNVHSRSQPSEIFKKREVPRRDPQPVAIRQRPRRRGAKDRPLLVQPADQPVGDLGHLLAAEHADQVVDLRARRPAALPCRARPGSRRRSRPAMCPRRFSSSISWIVANDSCRARSMNPQVLTTTKSAPCGSRTSSIAVELQQPQHPLAIDEVLGAAEADEGVRAFALARRGNRPPRRGLYDRKGVNGFAQRR